MKLTLFTDGAARGNPGPAGIGAILFDDNNEILEQYCKYLGTATNNVAEYQALIAGLQLAQKYLPCSIHVYLDSELVVQQMRGAYRVRNQNLAGYFQTAQKMLGSFEKIDFTHIPREQNKPADRLANQAIDTATV